MNSRNSSTKGVYRDKIKLQPYLLLLPAFISILCLQVLPMLQALYVSFVELKPKTWSTFFNTFRAPFVGLDNYKWIISGANGTMRNALNSSITNTVIYVLVINAVTLVLGLAIALSLNRKFKLSGIVRCLLLLPFIVPGFTVEIAWSAFFAEKSGLINKLLVDWLHLLPRKIDWYTDSRILWVLIIMAVWHYLPLSIIFLLSGLQNISKEYYEAADIDGAGHIRKLIYITLPLLRPAIAVLIFLGTILHVYYSYKILEWDLIIFFMHRHFFNNWLYSLGTAGVILVMLCVIAFIILWYLMFRKDFVSSNGGTSGNEEFIKRVKVYGIVDNIEDLLIGINRKLNIIGRIKVLYYIFTELYRKIPKWDFISPIVWLSAILIGFNHLISNIGHETLWYDESYSAAVTNHSIADIWTITSLDSHPPLYFIMLKIFSMVFGKSEGSLRLLSAVGILCLAMLGMGPVRRAFNKFTGIVFTIIVLILPMSLSMGQEARMYTLAAFFVTGSVLYGYLCTDKGKVSDFIKFGLFTLAAAYTHYYALLAVAIANAIIFVYLLIQFDKRKITAFIITAFSVVVCYIPWITALIGQVNKVSKDFWIPPVTGQVIWQALIYPFRAKFRSNFIFTIPSFIGAVLLIYSGICHAVTKRKKEGLLTGLAVLTYILTLAAAVIASDLIRPVFVERYIFPVVGLFLLSVSYGISNLKYKDVSIFILVVLLVFSIDPIVEINKEYFNGPMAQVSEYVNQRIQPDHVFIHTDEHTFGMFSYYFPDNKHYLYLPSGFKGFSSYAAFAPNGTAGSDIKGFLKGRKNVWVVNREFSYYSRYAFESALKDMIISDKLKYKEKRRDFRVDYSFYVIDVGLMIYSEN
ncbi:MAG: ABC transporter permease subunit [Bacillota bacterium]